jgi:hypothetical protein
MRNRDGDRFIRVELYNCGQVPARGIDIDISFALTGQSGQNPGLELPFQAKQRQLTIPPQRSGWHVDFPFAAGADAKHIGAAVTLKYLEQQSDVVPFQWRCEVKIAYLGLSSDTPFKSLFIYEQTDRDVPSAPVSSEMS